jgi:hypothetical protein
MFHPMRAQHRLPGRQLPQLRLNLRTRDGAAWELIVSAGMESFIGPYSQVPGLSSGRPLLEYQPVGCARSG